MISFLSSINLVLETVIEIILVAESFYRKEGTGYALGVPKLLALKEIDLINSLSSQHILEFFSSISLLKTTTTCSVCPT